MGGKIIKGILWLAAAVYAAVALLMIIRGMGEATTLRGPYVTFGLLFLGIGLVAAAGAARGKESLTSLSFASGVICLGLLVALFAAFWIDMEKSEVRRRAHEAEVHSGRYAFGEQPALLAVAQAIAANNQEVIRAAAKKVPDLQAAGREGTTLLCWTVRESWQRPELAAAVQTLLSLGADPNFTNGHAESFAMANAVHGPFAVLAAMLEAGGNPNARDQFGRPIALNIWHLGYYPHHQRARLELLLDRGADINSALPAAGSDDDGYTLLLRRTAMGLRDKNAYADALFLLERGADPNRTAADGMTFATMLEQHRQKLGAAATAAEFNALWQWAEAHSLPVRRP